jgi:hypothetical protein
MKNYTIIFNEKSAPQIKPSFDRSPTNLHRGIVSSPNNNGSSNANSKSNNNLNVANNSNSASMSNNSLNQKINKAANSSVNVPPRVQSFSTLARERVGTSATRLSSTSENKANEKKKELSESTEFSKLKLANYRSKPMQLTSLELKPTTVEVYFRSSSGKSKKIERKAIPATIFSPPKIGVQL